VNSPHLRHFKSRRSSKSDLHDAFNEIFVSESQFLSSASVPRTLQYIPSNCSQISSLSFRCYLAFARTDFPLSQGNEMITAMALGQATWLKKQLTTESTLPLFRAVHAAPVALATACDAI
jgi:hypothetical protein